MTILIITQNQRKELEICIDAIRRFADMNVSVVVVDNCSNDDTLEWLASQEDVAFANTEEEESVSQIINEVIEVFNINDDVLLLSPACAITPKCLSRMQNILDTDDLVMAVDAVVSGTAKEQAEEIVVSDYAEAVKASSGLENEGFRYVGSVQGEAVLFRKEILEKIGGFNESYQNKRAAIDAGMVEIISCGYYIARAEGALVYSMLSRGRKDIISNISEGKIKLYEAIQKNDISSVNLLITGLTYAEALIELKNRVHNAPVYIEEQNSDEKWICVRFSKEINESKGNKNLFDFIILTDKNERIVEDLEKYQQYLKADGKLFAEILFEKADNRFYYEKIINHIFHKGYDVNAFEVKNGAEILLGKKKKKRILIWTGNITIMQYNAKQIAEAYENIGWEVVCKDAHNVKDEELLDIIRKGIDRVFVINNTGWIVWIDNSKNLWDYLEIPTFNYTLDHPVYYDDTLSVAPELGTMLCLDRNHVYYVERFYEKIKKTLFLPLGGDNSFCGIDRKWEKRPIDIFFAGAYKADLDIRNLSDREHYIFEELQKKMQAPTEAVIEELLVRENPTVSENEVYNEIRNNRKVDWYMVTYIRMNVIKTLLDAGINVTVYGGDWEKCSYVNHPNFIYGGYISQSECLKKMAESKIVLNVMPWFKDGIHDRVINAMLAGAVCLTDGSGYMREMFKKGEDYVEYDLEQLEQLPQIIKQILANNNDELRHTAYNKAASEHRWLHRIEELEKWM